MKPSIVFFGTTRFSAYVLAELVHAGYQILLIVTKPDERSGRGLALLPPELKQWASTELPHVPVFQPEKASLPEAVAYIASFNPDFFVVAAFGEILSEELLGVPSIAPLNVHTSLLPKYRGASPIRRAIWNGENETGISIIQMSRQLDAGGVIAAHKVPIYPEDDFGALEKRLMEAAFTPLLAALIACASKQKQLIAQDQALVTQAPKFKKEDFLIDWSLPAFSIVNRIRALSPQPGAYTLITLLGDDKPKRMKIFSAKIEENIKLQEAFLVKEGALFVKTGSFPLRILRVQQEGKRVMEIADFLKGAKITNLGECCQA